jgi:hypothetical protein
VNQDATPAVPPTYDIRATFAGPSKQVMVGAFDLRSGIRSIQIATLVVRPHDHVVRRTGSIPGLLLERTTTRTRDPSLWQGSSGRSADLRKRAGQCL